MLSPSTRSEIPVFGYIGRCFLGVFALGAICTGSGLSASAQAPEPLTPETEASEAATLETATSGEITATLSAESSQNRCIESHIQIKRGDQIYLEESVTVSSPEEATCISSDLQVQDLDADGEPEVFFLNYSGGVHCCFSSQIYRYDPERDIYSPLSQEWGNTDYALEDFDGDGILEFVSHDDRFAYAFASFSGSRFPIQIWQYRAGSMYDVTRNFPEQVYADAYYQWLGYQDLVAMRPPVEEAAYWYQVEQAALAAYLADKHLLGQGADGWQRVFATYQWPDRETFFQTLSDFLGEKGYLDNGPDQDEV